PALRAPPAQPLRQRAGRQRIVRRAYGGAGTAARLPRPCAGIPRRQDDPATAVPPRREACVKVPLRPAIEAEQRALHATLAALGPDAPTQCAGWTTRELAAHLSSGVIFGGALAVGGRQLVARVPVRMGAAGARVNDRLVRSRRARDFESSLAHL